jgi:hypothetical protein
LRKYVPVQLVVGLAVVLGVRAMPKKSVVQKRAAGVVHAPFGKCVLVQLVAVMVSVILGNWAML